MGTAAHMQGHTASAPAPAKVNLSLHITGRREDGYHLLDSLILPLDLVDSITITRRVRPGLVLRCPGHPELETHDNLAAKAARLFWELAGIPPENQGLELIIEKRIPVAAGLGGGSSDAATVLRLMHELYGPPPCAESLRRESVRLGADVPMFYEARPRFISGIGDELGEALEIEPLHVVLANPGYPVSTRWVYETFAKKEESIRLTNLDIGDRKPGRFWDRGDVVRQLHNDLESVTLEKHRDLFQMKEALRRARAVGTLMSGSGPTVFGIFESGEDAACALERLGTEFGTWRFWQATNFTSDGDWRGCNGDH